MSRCAAHVVCIQVGTTQQKVDDDEREVRRLERLLGMNKRKDKNKLPASFTREGLDCIHKFLIVPLCLSLMHARVPFCVYVCACVHGVP